MRTLLKAAGLAAGAAALALSTPVVASAAPAGPSATGSGVPSCVVAETGMVDQYVGYARATNNCSTTQRVKFYYLAWPTTCLTLAPGQSGEIHGAGGAWGFGIQPC
ncbi:hypothetical protein [Kitasatospora sp. NPDC090091]|uniref:hypothetical protein n=1 Tax=Kitasatospora sp. NPDC090091 TaxID=3364081 RepID=UPI00381F0363